MVEVVVIYFDRPVVAKLLLALIRFFSLLLRPFGFGLSNIELPKFSLSFFAQFGLVFGLLGLILALLILKSKFFIILFYFRFLADYNQ